MIVTILEGKLSPDKIPLLRKKYNEILQNRPPSIVNTYLLNDTKNQNIYKIITVWKRKEDLEAMRKQGTPAGVLLFRELGMEPALNIYEVIGQS